MKTIKNQQSLILTVGLPLSIFFFLLIWFFPSIIVICLRFHWLILLLSLALSLCPWGKIRLATPTDTHALYPWPIWLSKIVGLQLALQLLFTLSLYFVTQVFPIKALPYPHVSNGLLYLTFMQGLFPWPAFSLVGISFGLVAYNRQQDAYFHNTLQSVWPSKPGQALAIIANLLPRGMTLLAMSGTLTLLSLWGVYEVGKFTWPLASGFNAASFVIIICLVIICLLKRTQRWLKRRIFSAHRTFTSNLLLAACFFGILLFLLNGIVHSWQAIAIKPPAVLNRIEAYPSNIWWILFINAWWLLWLPIVAIQIAYYSRGYQLRQILLATLCWPVVSSLLLLAYQQHAIFLSHPLPSPLCFLLFLLSAVTVFYLISHGDRLSMLILCYLPKAGTIKPRSPLILLSRAPIFMSFILYVYLPVGLLLLSPLYLLCVFAFTLLALISMVSGLYGCFQLRQKKTCK